ncbi:MAG: isoleucine--tRNA ligase, partial [Rikenellaceae bacterium]|nr:isoleucine--tRNA ligase [Rikenellaceae bacterium]
ELEGLRYEQLMPWVKPLEKADNNAAEWVKAYAAEHPEKCFDIQKDRFVELSECAFRVIPGDYVTTDDGTGIVHIAPTFGADDAKVAKAAGIPSLFMINKRGETRPMVDMTGKYYLMEECDATFVEKCVNAEGYKQHEGNYVKNAYDPQFNPDGKYDEKAAAKAEDLNIFLCMEMKQAGTALKIEKHTHNYPHCWRTDKPVLYYPLDSWFIRTTACRERMMELNEGIYWKPESTGSGRFGKWLENLQDWNLSRSRFWGTPLPIWATDDYSELKCIGSVEELKAEIEKSIAAGVMTTNPYADFNVGDFSKENYDKIDLHRPYVDNIVLVSSKGEPMHRESDLIDVWFDSGAMPYAQVHFPFEMSKEEFLKVYPSDFIAEGVDQTRGWFFTLHALGTMLFDSVAFKNIISNGLVLDKNGNKMSKRLGNAIDPFEVMDKYGVDAVRWYIISNSQPWDNLKFDVDGVDEVRRKFFGTLYNTYSFFALYANVDGFTGREAEVPVEERPEIDRWIISLLNTLVANVTKCLDDYDPTPAARMIQEFVGENLSNWYVRLNRKRFWGGEMNTDKLAAYQTLYTCLETVAQLSAPFAPFIAEQIFCDLNAMSGRHTEESVHLALFPKSNAALVNSDLEEMMAVAQQVSSMVLALRRKVNIKVRQPLTKIIVPLLDEKLGAHIEAVKSLIMGEVNIKDIELISDTTGLITKRIKPNFKTLGPRYGKYMKQIAALVAEMSQEQIAEIEASESYVLNVAGEDLTLERADFEITSDDMPGWLVASEGKLTVALDIT